MRPVSAKLSSITRGSDLLWLQRKAYAATVESEESNGSAIPYYYSVIQRNSPIPGRADQDRSSSPTYQEEPAVSADGQKSQVHFPNPAPTESNPNISIMMVMSVCSTGRVRPGTAEQHISFLLVLHNRAQWKTPAAVPHPPAQNKPERGVHDLKQPPSCCWTSKCQEQWKCRGSGSCLLR